MLCSILTLPVTHCVKVALWDSKYLVQNKCFLGIPIYRASEALLNYMEASYEKNQTLDNTAREYWQLLRRRALVSENIDATIAATDMNKEAENDWGAYSAGKILVDKTLYNIRRERRCEYISEGLRWMDLCRWRAMDQLMVKPYIPEGMHLWNTPMERWYDNSGQVKQHLFMVPVRQMCLHLLTVSICFHIERQQTNWLMMVSFGKWLIIWIRYVLTNSR